jgi:hypothetical protein
MRNIQRLDWGEIENPPIGYLVNIATVLEVDLPHICEDRWLKWMVLDKSATKPPPRQHWVSGRD